MISSGVPFLRSAALLTATAALTVLVPQQNAFAADSPEAEPSSTQLGAIQVQEPLPLVQDSSPIPQADAVLAQEATPVPQAIPGSAPETAIEPAKPSPWAATAELYGFFPLRTSGTTTIRGIESELDLDLEQVLRPLTRAAYLRGSVEYERLGLLTDLSYLQLDGAQTRTGRRGRRSLSGNLTQIQGLYDLALRYRIGDREQAIATPGSFTLIPYAGVRFVDIQLNLGLDFQGPRRQVSRSASFGGTIAQPLLGTWAQVFLTPRLRLFARGDVGGFGTNGDDLSANAQVGLGYAVGNNTQLNLSWRLLHLEDDNGRTPRNAYDLNQNGIEAGVKFFF